MARNFRDGSISSGFIIALVLGCASIALVCIFAHGPIERTASAYDHWYYHLPTVLQMSGQWPCIDLVKYPSAAAPGYYIFLACFYRAFANDLLIIQFFSLLSGGALILIVFYLACKYTLPIRAAALTFPLMCSTYLIERSFWIGTDNASWLLVCVCLGSCLRMRTTHFKIFVTSFAATLAVCIRQTNVWLAVPVFLSGATPEFFAVRFYATFRSAVNAFKIRTLVSSCVASLAPIVVIVILCLLWHQIVPQAECASRHAAGGNFAIVCVTMGLFGLYGIFFLPLALDELRTVRWISRYSLVLLLVSSLVSIMYPTGYSRAAGRSGGLIWELVKVSPVYFERSVLLSLLTLLGVMVLLVLFRSVHRAGRHREAVILLLSLLSCLVCNSANSASYQRYGEYLVLVMLILLSSMGSTKCQLWHREFALLGPVLLGFLQLICLFLKCSI